MTQIRALRLVLAAFALAGAASDTHALGLRGWFGFGGKEDEQQKLRRAMERAERDLKKMKKEAEAKKEAAAKKLAELAKLAEEHQPESVLG